MKSISYEKLVSLVRETISESKRTQDKRLSAFTNSITKSIMAIYSGREPHLSYDQISEKDLVVDPNTSTQEFYEISAGSFPLSFDESSIDRETYEDGVDPFLDVVLEIDRDAPNFNVAASDKSSTGMADIGIHIAIETPKDFSRKDYGKLRKEVANAVRHELEHVTQGEMSDQPARAFGRNQKYYTFLNDPESVDSAQAKYLLDPTEIPAHIRGYVQNAKNIKEFIYDIDDLLVGYMDQGLINKKEKQIILDTWVDWVKNNTNKKGYR